MMTSVTLLTLFAAPALAEAETCDATVMLVDVVPLAQCQVNGASGEVHVCSCGRDDAAPEDS